MSALASWSSGRVEEALTLLRHSIDKHPELPIFPMQMAYALTAIWNEGEAQWWQDQVLKLNPQEPNVWQWWCMGFLNLGDPLSAANCADQLNKAYPELIQSLQVYRGEFDAAIATQKVIMERFP